MCTHTHTHTHTHTYIYIYIYTVDVTVIESERCARRGKRASVTYCAAPKEPHLH
jgi:hypothetical protein